MFARSWSKSFWHVLLHGNLKTKFLFLALFLSLLVLSGALLSFLFFDVPFSDGCWWVWTHMMDPGFLGDDKEDLMTKKLLGSFFAIMGILAVAGTMAALLEDIAKKLLEDLRIGRVPADICGHTVIAGSGPRLKNFMAAVMVLDPPSNNHEMVVVVSEPSLLEETKKNCENQGLVTVEQIWQDEGIPRLHLERARRILLLENFGGNNGEMLKTITRLAKLRAELKPLDELKVYVEMNNRILLPILQTSLRAFKSVEAKMEVCLMNMDDTSARLAILDHPLEAKHRLNAGGKVVLVIFGWSAFGDALFRQALRIAHYPTKPTRIVIVALGADVLQQKIDEEAPGLTNSQYSSEILTVEYCAQASLPELMTSEQDSVTVAVCGDNPDDVFARAVQITSLNLPGLLQVFADLPDGSGYRDVIGMMPTKLIVPVGSHAKAFELSEVLDRFARQGHERYIRQREDEEKRVLGSNGEYKNPADYDWEMLDEIRRGWNRSPIDHAEIKLRVLADRCQLERPVRTADGNFDISPELKQKVLELQKEVKNKIKPYSTVLEDLSSLEHDRWAGEKFAEGWVFAEAGDKARKKSEYLVRYELLDDVIKHYDREQVIAQLECLIGN